MRAQWTEDGAREIGEIARRHGFSDEAGRAMADALAAGAGAMAQFHHPDLGGMGQWSRGGMLMIGDMFNTTLKGQVAGLAADLSDAIGRGVITQKRPAHGEASSGHGQWWPAELGHPSSTGAQNSRRYAVFPDRNRLAIESDGHVSIYDTGDHLVSGAAQQQGANSRLTFSTNRGSVGVEMFREVRETSAQTDGTQADTAGLRPKPALVRNAASEQSEPAPSQDQRFSPEPARSASSSPSSATSGASSNDPVELIRKLATLKDAGLLTDEEFQAKKTELLSRI